MDYKYIEQLLERYWQCETTLQEEAILRTFFSQPDSSDLPESLRRYRDLFYCQTVKEEPLDSDFDRRILEKIDVAPKAETFTLKDRLMPLFRAAAIVAIILTLGNAAQAPWEWGWNDPKDDYAKFHQENVDSVNMLGTIQAENISDSIKAIATD